MAKFELKLPKMGESVAEATITNWLKNVGDSIDADEAVLEIATDKVDSEVPSEVSGVLVEQLFKVDDVVQVGQTIAIIETEGTASVSVPSKNEEAAPAPEVVEAVEKTVVAAKESVAPVVSSSDRFYSPLVKSIAAAEGISQQELDAIQGTGKDGRVTKNDILAYVENRGDQTTATAPEVPVVQTQVPESKLVKTSAPISISGQDEIIEMTRMGKIIAHHMIESVQTSAHVQSFIEVDVTNIVKWRDKVKSGFEKREGEK